MFIIRRLSFFKGPSMVSTHWKTLDDVPSKLETEATNSVFQ